MKLFQGRMLSLKHTLFLLLVPGIVLLFLLEASLNPTAHAQVAPAITPTPGAGSLGTTVTQSGSVYNIIGGTRPGGGTNLFHSFGEFSVPTNNIANFLNDSGLATSNILGRVTGGNISNIFGTIQTTGFGNANLFLMNPAGFLFGPNATVNVGGMVAFTSADYLRLTNGGRFNATPDAAADALLTPSPVAAFGFLGSNPGAITVQGSHLTVTEGTGISLIGGDITIQSGTLADGTIRPARVSAPGKQINLAGASSPGEVLATTFNPSGSMTLGSITLSQESILDVSAEGAGTIRIRGGQLQIVDSTILADTGDNSGASIAVDITVLGDLPITDTRGIPAITARTNGMGDAGAIQITAGNLTATTSFLDPSFLPTTLLDSHTSGDGRGGDVSIATGNLTAMGTPGSNLFTFIDSGTTANGRGGDVTIGARTIDLNALAISTGQLNASAFVADLSTVNGSAGHLTMTADTVKTLDGAFDTSALFGTSPLQQGGDMTITAHDISMVNTQVSSINTDGGGALSIKADSIRTDFTTFEIDTTSGPGGGISVDSHVVELTNGSAMVSSTFGTGNAGDIRVTATDHVSIVADLGTNPLATSQPSGFFSNSFGNIFGTLGGPGNAGNIIVTTPKLEMNGGRINTVTSSNGQGGNVTLNVPDTISISGEFHTDFLRIPSVFDIGPLAPSGVVTSTVGGEFCVGVCGNAGIISINTGSLLMGPGSQINSGTSSNGHGVGISIHAANTISLSGTLSDGRPVGVFSRSLGTAPDTGAGGNISLTAGQSVNISNGAAISASSTGPGNTGNIQINAGNQFAMTNSSVTTEANQASGGAIKITTTPSGTVQLTDSTISASVLDGAGGGGSVNIDPQVIILQNSQILAQAVQGPGGNISITTNLLLPDANSGISASSQFGVNGTVTIQSPNAPASGKIQPLGNQLLEATSLLNQRCAALAGGEFSSFTMAGRDILPAEPGSWLASPLYAAGIGEGQGVRGEGRDGDTRILSLRQMAPAGFLTQAFAVDWSTGCQS